MFPQNAARKSFHRVLLSPAIPIIPSPSQAAEAIPVTRPSLAAAEEVHGGSAPGPPWWAHGVEQAAALPRADQSSQLPVWARTGPTEAVHPTLGAVLSVLPYGPPRMAQRSRRELVAIGHGDNLVGRRAEDIVKAIDTRHGG
jgi:hypothetical protein